MSWLEDTSTALSCRDSLQGCSLKTYAINMVGDALAEGNSVYETDEDIELVGQALPFGLKLTESLLEQSPNHRGLLLTACRGFVLYSYGYVHRQAELSVDDDLDRAQGDPPPRTEALPTGQTRIVCALSNESTAASNSS